MSPAILQRDDQMYSISSQVTHRNVYVRIKLDRARATPTNHFSLRNGWKDRRWLTKACINCHILSLSEVVDSISTPESQEERDGNC